MIFSEKSRRNIASGLKTQTRRLVKKGEYEQYGEKGEILKVMQLKVMNLNGMKWQVNKIYSIQRGRGFRGEGKIKLLGIRKENLWSISGKDVTAEGFFSFKEFHEEFIKTNFQSVPSIYPENWNPKVWVLEFEKVLVRD